MPNGKEKKFERSHLLSQSKGKIGSSPQWQDDPENMLKHRSDSKCCRTAFPQIFAGLHNPDEIREYDDFKPIPEYQDGKGNVITKEESDKISKLDLD